MAALVLVLAVGLPRLAKSILPEPLPLLPGATFPRLPPLTVPPRAVDGPQGMPVGSARLNAQAEAGLGYDSNLFAQRRALAVGDAFRTESVRARLDTDWSRHALAFEAAVDDRGYFKRTQNNTTDWTLGLLGRYDLSRDLSVEGSYRHQRSHLSVADPTTQVLGVLQPVPFDRDEARLGATWRRSNLTLRAEAGASSLRYQDLRGVALSANDRVQAGIGVFAAWAFAPRNAVTFALSGDVIRYDQRGSRPQDGEAWQAVAGMTWAENALWRARATAGLFRREFQGPGLKPLEGVAVDAALTWLPTRLTAVTLAAQRGLDDVLRADPVPSIRSVVSLSAQHEATRDLTLRGELRLDRREINGPRRVADDGVVSLGVEWRFGRRFALVGQYDHGTRLRGFPGLPNYNRDVLSLRLRSAL